jgi:hypothetical protein
MHHESIADFFANAFVRPAVSLGAASKELPASRRSGNVGVRIAAWRREAERLSDATMVGIGRLTGKRRVGRFRRPISLEVPSVRQIARNVWPMRVRHHGLQE